MNAPDAEAEAQRYSMVIEWSDTDEAYIVTVPELPGCMTHAEAVKQGEAAIATWLATARAYGDPIHHRQHIE
jgi:predicted RNase H-like HicB family nuclease